MASRHLRAGRLPPPAAGPPAPRARGRRAGRTLAAVALGSARPASFCLRSGRRSGSAAPQLRSSPRCRRPPTRP